MGPVEDADLAAGREGLVDAPDVVVGSLSAAGSLERDDLAALRIDAGEDASDRAALARGVESLQDEENAAPGLSPEMVLKDRELLDQLREGLSPLALAVEAQVVARVALVELEARPRLDDQSLSHRRQTRARVI